MKGIIKILEAILASIVLLVSLSFFFSTQVIYPDNTIMLVQAEDSLSALHKSGLLIQYIKDNNVAQLNNDLSSLLPSSSAHSTEVYGLPKPLIKINCICTPSEANELETMLSPLIFEHEKRQIEIRVKQSDFDNIDSESDILFVIDYQDFYPYKQEINEFLTDGKTLFLLADIPPVPLITDTYLNEIFNLSHSPGTSLPSAVFHQASNPLYESYHVSEYYENLSGIASTFPMNDNEVGVDEKTILKTDLLGTHSFVKINLLTKGRAVWFADYDHNNVEVNRMLKAMILWSVSKGYFMDMTEKSAQKELSQSLSTAYRLIPASPTLEESFIVKLHVWKIFF